MKINSDPGYEPVTYSELTQDEAFWAGCKSWCELRYSYEQRTQELFVHRHAVRSQRSLRA